MMDIVMIIVGFVCLMILQHECHKQDIQTAYKEGYYAGLYQNVIKMSSDETN